MNKVFPITCEITPPPETVHRIPILHDNNEQTPIPIQHAEQLPLSHQIHTSFSVLNQTVRKNKRKEPIIAKQKTITQTEAAIFNSSTGFTKHTSRFFTKFKNAVAESMNMP